MKSSDKTEFGLQRVLCLGKEIKERCITTNFNDFGTIDLLFSEHIQMIDEL